MGVYCEDICIDEIESLRQQLAECKDDISEIPQICRRYDKQLAEFQARVAELEAENQLAWNKCDEVETELSRLKAAHGKGT
jgi:chromosome segregation ATPase